MSAREVIARALEDGNFVDVGFSIDGARAADAILEALAADGHRILVPGELDKRTLLAVATRIEANRGHEHSDWSVGYNTALVDIAAGLRSLTVDGEKP